MVFEVWTASVKGNTSPKKKKKKKKRKIPPGTTMRRSWGRDLGVSVVWTEVKHIYKSWLGALVELTGEASWGLAEVSFRVREHRGFFFFFFFLTSVQTRGQSGWLIIKENNYTTSTVLQIFSNRTLIHILQLSLACKPVNNMVLNSKYKRKVLQEMRLPSCNYNNPQWTSL